jgi:BirA family transcriptional regulator, biotin operon repressor / biotin---[acetyl-CoA-carboxylase] ligase
MDAPAALPGFYSVLKLPMTESTSEDAKRLARSGAAEGTLIWALEQSSGHGRLGRAWISPPGNLYFSVLLRPDRPAYEALQVTFVAAVALADAIATMLELPRTLTCKWPNDLLIRGRKVSGILLESTADDQGRVDSLVVGIGVNVTSFPPDHLVQYPATSLHAQGAQGETAQSVLEKVSTTFLGRYEQWRRYGFNPIRAAWLERAEKLHQPIEVRLDDETVRGVFADLHASGALVLRQGDQQRLILAGDVFPVAA